ncbi:MAG: porin family protein [Chitinophagaceae bacterium]
MKKIFFYSIVFQCVFFAAHSQPPQFGIQAGINFSGASAKNENEKFKGSPLPGLEAGAFADVPLTGNLFFRPQAIFSYERYKPKIDPFDANIHVFYFKIPLTVVYHSSLADGKLSFGLGPYIGWALSGKYHRSGGGFENVSTKINFGNDENEDDLKSLDAGVNLLACYQLKKTISAIAKFDLGITNISPGSADIVYHTRSFSVGIGYWLEKK